MGDAVVVNELVKRYLPGAPAAVDGLGFSVRQGEVFGLLGPNGAGKTTTIGVLTTRILPTSGYATVAGMDVTARPKSARRALAVVPQHNNLDRSLNVRQNLLYHAAYHGVARSVRRARAAEIISRIGLDDHADAKVDRLSGGLAQRVMIARALMHRPEVLFLDEPSSGLDPQSRLFVHDEIRALREDGVTVVVTTHDMEEAAKLCDRVGIIDHGKMLKLDSPATMTNALPGSSALTVTVDADDAKSDSVVQILSEMDNVERVEKIGAGAPAPPPGMPGMPMPPWMAPPPQQPVSDGVRFRLYTSVEPAAVLPIMLKVLGGIGCDITDLSVSKPSLEDVFLHLTGRNLR
ncbi:ABC transporter ATP-binding protein [Saccharomonospora piscinae]|uniref:Bacteriocin ABC transporter ATP-binding protein n=1 Tax=Saccharomonospora piscinae TaxID=687388 RepID=A0A1V8ZXR0_SACPI|nr:ABC transporter ATP-binding protein [Saccharomonospora piscinae]OQO89695.1 bacteriocin ABC transporter ATP-binding protein [Saccharomonospora piscinae]TLW91374.1 ABC transporter ATP-binding protein [Saccharomonospora piscinae]